MQDRRDQQPRADDGLPGRPLPVAYLDRVLAEDTAKGYKRQMLELLHPRDGDWVLDIGCDTGDDTHAIARLVAPTGKVIGIDSDARMLSEAWRRAAPLRLPLGFRVGDAQRLDFEPATFSACRSDRVWQHLRDPEAALAEVVRVARPRARIVIADVDRDLLAIDIEPRTVTRRIVAWICDRRVAHGWSGRRLPGLFTRAGLEDVTVWPSSMVTTDRTAADRLWQLRNAADGARARRRPSPATSGRRGRPPWTGLRHASSPRSRASSFEASNREDADDWRGHVGETGYRRHLWPGMTRTITRSIGSS
ncbi:MAG: methyltransferase domain-containing protein [Vicinamibacterales bacterium]